MDAVMSIRDQIALLDAQIEELEIKIDKIVESCPHAQVTNTREPWGQGFTWHRTICTDCGHELASACV